MGSTRDFPQRVNVQVEPFAGSNSTECGDESELLAKAVKLYKRADEAGCAET